MFFHHIIIEYFLKLFFPFRQEGQLHTHFILVFILTFHVYIIELRVIDWLFRKLQPQHSTKDNYRFNHPMYL